MESKILKILSFVSIVMAYSFHFCLWSGAFYHLTAFCFVALTRIIFLRSSRKWKMFSLLMNLMAINNFIDELFFDPLVIDYNEYTTLAVSIILVSKYRNLWMKK